jgi:YD repeat-containing protein
MKNLLVALGLTIIVPASVNAAINPNEVDISKYEVYQGDLNSDGKVDYYFHGKRIFVPIAGDILIPIFLTAPQSFSIQATGGNLFLVPYEVTYNAMEIVAHGLIPSAADSSTLQDVLANATIEASNAGESELPTTYAKKLKYAYDELGRLTFVEDSQNGNRDYDYDKAGNRLLVSTNVANDSTTEPVTALPAPTGLAKSHIADCAWKATWSAVSGATQYLVIDTTGGSQSVTATLAYINCPTGNPTGNQPKSVQACTSSTSCGPKAYF